MKKATILFATAILFAMNSNAQSIKSDSVNAAAQEKKITFKLTNQEMTLLSYVIDKSTAEHTSVTQLIGILNARITEQLKQDAEMQRLLEQAGKVNGTEPDNVKNGNSKRSVGKK